MFKAIGLLQLSLAPVFVLPAVTGQEGDATSIEAQLAATMQSIDYLRGLEVAVRSGDAAAVRALERSTAEARDATPQRTRHLETLQDDLARLRFSLDQLLADPAEVEAVMAMPPEVVRVLGLGGAAAAAPAAPAGDRDDAPREEVFDPAHPDADERGVVRPSGGATRTGTAGAALPSPAAPPARVADRTAVAITDPAAARPARVAGTGPTVGLDAAMRAALQDQVGPLDEVRATSRRRGSEPVALEDEDYVADPVALGRLLVRSRRPAEALEVLEPHTQLPGARYWLARAYQQLDRNQEALEVFRALSADEEAGVFRRHAKQDLDFLEFKEALEKRRR